MPYALVGGAAAGGAATATTTGFDSSTGKLIVVAVGRGGAAGVHPTISGTINGSADGNTYTYFSSPLATPFGFLDFYHCVTPSVGINHAFTVTTGGGGDNPGISVAVFSASGTVAFDATTTTGTSSSSSPSSSGTVTPSANNALVISAIEFEAGTANSIGSGFAIAATEPFVGGTNFASGIAYLVQSTASAINPIWTLSGSTGWGNRLITFTGGGASGTVLIPPELFNTMAI